VNIELVFETILKRVMLDSLPVQNAWNELWNTSSLILVDRKCMSSLKSVLYVNTKN